MATSILNWRGSALWGCDEEWQDVANADSSIFKADFALPVDHACGFDLVNDYHLFVPMQPCCQGDPQIRSWRFRDLHQKRAWCICYRIWVNQTQNQKC